MKEPRKMYPDDNCKHILKHTKRNKEIGRNYEKTVEIRITKTQNEMEERNT